jgi:hypothetical protein
VLTVPFFSLVDRMDLGTTPFLPSVKAERNCKGEGKESKREREKGEVNKKKYGTEREEKEREGAE